MHVKLLALVVEGLAETGLLNTISISFRGVESHLLVQALGDKVLVVVY
jgi:hypothetical protein